MKIKYMEKDTSIKEAGIDRNNDIKFVPGGIICWIILIDVYGNPIGTPEEKFFPFSSLVEIKELFRN